MCASRKISFRESRCSTPPRCRCSVAPSDCWPRAILAVRRKLKVIPIIREVLATDHFAQASVLDLWDPDRSQTVTRYGDISNWVNFVAALSSARDVLALKNGEGLRILTETVNSPTVADLPQTIKENLPAAKWHVWEPAARNTVTRGAQLAFGRAVEPVYHFENADVIVSLDSD